MKNQTIFSVLFKAFAVVLVFSFASCEEDDDHHEGNTAVITIVSPVEHSTYSLGDTLHITGEAVGEEELHGYDIYIVTSGDTVFTASKSGHGDTLPIHEHWEPIDTIGDMTMSVVVTLDHDGNKQTKTVLFHCIP